MKHLTIASLSLIGAAALAACAGAHVPVTTTPPAAAKTRDSSAVQLGTALATVEQDSAADQSALDSLHERSPDSHAAEEERTVEDAARLQAIESAHA